MSRQPPTDLSHCQKISDEEIRVQFYMQDAFTTITETNQDNIKVPAIYALCKINP